MNACAGGEIPPLDVIREGVLKWLESVRDKKTAYGRYAYSRHPVRKHDLYSSVQALSFRRDLNDLDGLTEEQLRQIICYLQNCQDPQDGFFKDPSLHPVYYQITSETHNPEHIWWYTDRAGDVIEMLGARPLYPRARPVRFQVPPDALEQWIEGQPWATHPWGAAMGQVSFFMMCKYNEHGQDVAKTMADPAMQFVWDWLWQHQDPATGFWGTDRGADPLPAMCGAYYLMCRCDKFNIPMRRSETIVESTIHLMNTREELRCRKSSGCTHTDSLNLLYHHLQWHDTLGEEIKAVWERIGPDLMAHAKPDRGFSFYVDRALDYHNSIAVTAGGYPESDMLGTRMYYVLMEHYHEVMNGQVERKR